MSITEPGPGVSTPPPIDPWVAASRSDEFIELRRRLHGFIFPLTALFLGWYFLYVLLAAFAPAFMSWQVAGNINIGLIFGLLQFVTTFAITISYGRFATRRLDPVSERIRAGLEGRRAEEEPQEDRVP